MRYGILGDIHSNESALDAVLGALAGEGVVRLVSVGDLVGYGPSPVACVRKVQSSVALVVAGNHDLAAIGRFDLEYFNPLARAAVEWTARALGDPERVFLGSLPLLAVEGQVCVAHGSPFEPERFAYVETLLDAERALRAQPRRVCFVGHSHFPITFLSRASDPEHIWYTTDPEVDLRTFDRALVNVGSVGQPRDGDARAAYAVYDEEEDRVRIRRVPYDVEREVARILEAGLPPPLAERLRRGT